MNNQGQKRKNLFLPNLPGLEWIQFSAEGYEQSVSGTIFRANQPPCCGVPLGGISTGCLDLDPRGTFGFSSIFNPSSQHHTNKIWRYPRKLPTIHPFLGLAVGGKTWVLATEEMASGEPVAWCTEPQMLEREGKQAETFQVGTPKVEGVEFAREIEYWGHYPVVDMEYDTEAPVSVGLRAWAPFIPGDAAASNIPAAVFEVHLRNPGDRSQEGSLAFSFPGPDAEEARGIEFTRREIQEDFHGMLVSSTGEVQYLLGVLGGEAVRFGSGLNGTPDGWVKIARELPRSGFRQQGGERLYQEGSCSAAVDFNLGSGQEKVVRFLLTWFAPVWEGNTRDALVMRQPREETKETGPTHRYIWVGSDWESTHYFTHMYAVRYASAVDIARRMSEEHEVLIKRVFAWQKVIYAENSLPAWLRDSLVNNLALIPEDSYWAQAKPPLGDWAHPGGVFSLLESPRGCPELGCIPCDWYGNLPIVFFFPELAHSMLASFKQFQKDDGEVPFVLGIIGDLPDFAVPGYHWQVALNGMCYVDLLDRLWLRTGDDAILKEFYASAKKCNTFTMELSSAPNAVINMPDEGGMEWFEFGEWAGMASHMGGLRLAQLRMVERMAEALGDTPYAQQCRDWYAEGSRAMEEEMWTGSYYLNFFEKETGKKSDDVMGYQLDGEWAARYHGLSSVFLTDRISTTLETIRRCNIALTPEVGAANFTRPDGSPLPSSSKVAEYGLYAMFPPELLVLAMTYMYAGEQEFGLELARKHWETLCLKHGHIWDLPNIVRGDTGKRVFGTDYYQNMMLWALPAAIAGQDIKASSAPGSLIDRVIQAGNRSERRYTGIRDNA